MRPPPLYLVLGCCVVLATYALLLMGLHASEGETATAAQPSASAAAGANQQPTPARPPAAVQPPEPPRRPPVPQQQKPALAAPRAPAPATPAATDGQRVVRVMVTKYPHIQNAWLHPNKFPCHVPCTLIQPKNFKPESQALLDGIDIYQMYGNDGAHPEFYDVMQNPRNFTLMMTNYNNFESPHVAKEGYRWIAKLYHQPRLWDHFHIVNSHQQGSIVPFQTWTHLLAIPGVLPWVTKHAKPDLKQKRTDAVAVLIASHAGHTFNRVQIAVNLSRLIPLHVYGKVTPRVRGLNPAITSPPRPDCPPSTWYDPVITPCLLSPYPFTLAFENSMADDYASEKVYNPLLVGSVPVYAGAPNIENLVPPRSIIRLSDFATLEDLAYYLKCLLDHPELYAQYTAWRDRSSATWARIQASPHPLCAACALVARRDPVLRNTTARFPRAVPVQRENVGSQAPFPQCLRPGSA